MSQKLEDRLHLYERDHPIRDDQELISALEGILEEQDELPVEDRDFDLISEATDAVLHLSGYSNEQLSNLANKAISSVKTRITSPHESSSCGTTKPRHHAIIRWLVSIAVILSIATVAVFASPTNRLAISEMTNRLFSSLKPKTIYHEENVDLVFTDNIQTYSSFDELSASFNHSLLLPLDLESDIRNLSICVYDIGQSFDISIQFDYDDCLCYITIECPQNHSERDIDYSTRIGGLNVALYNCDDNWNAVWEDNNNLYQIESYDLDTLKSIISNMR